MPPDTVSPPYRTRISVRLALRLGAVTIVVLAVLGLLVYVLLGGALLNNVDDAMRDQAVTLVDELVDEDEFDTAELEEELISDGAGRIRAAQVVDDSGQVLAATGPLRGAGALVTPARLTEVDADTAAVATVTVGDTDYRTLTAAIGDRGAVLVLAEDMAAVTGPQRDLLGILIPTSLLAALLAGATGWVTAHRGLQPLQRLADEAAAVDAGDLHRRLPAPERDDEVARLAGTLNAMLDRLQTAIDRERTFTADASHQLRTPLAILRAELEIAQGRAAEPARRRLDSAMEETDRLAALVNDLLVLARADADHLDGAVVINLGDLVAQTAARLASLARRHDITLTCHGNASITGDPSGIERAVINLVDNAVRHTPDHGAVTITCQPITDGARVTVTDTGPGAPPDQLAHLFDRFHRNTGNHSGAGLGLAIVSAVADAHNGHANATNNPHGGLTVTLELHNRQPSPSGQPPSPDRRRGRG